MTTPSDTASSRPARLVLAAAILLAGAPTIADAYIGPGAGFAVLGSFAVVFVTMLLAGVAVLAWPFRMVWRALRRRRRARPLVRRVVFIGFDGQDAAITERLMAEGKLPNLSRLAERGSYRRLRTTFPSITPVAWSSFSTGANPGRHNIFDFLDRDPRTYLPRLSSAHIGPVTRFLKLGKLRIPLARPDIRLLRRSKPWWTILGEHNVWSTVIRVPITFPPDRFHGAQLGAMCIPDLLGTQGTFMLFTTRPESTTFEEGGVRVALEHNGSASSFTATVKGPENAFREGNPPMELPLELELDRAAGAARVAIDGSVVDLRLGELSGWVELDFPAIAGMKVGGLTRMMLTEAGEHVSLYLSPINISPGKPAMPISHPSYYSSYLEKRIGPFATLGLAEDTWALNEKVTDDATFWTQTQDIDAERERMLHVGLDRLRSGALVTVFDATDRVNHMYWRYIEDGHPAAAGVDRPEYGDAIERQYIHNDGIVGRVLERLDEQDVLFVLSDHGCTSFRRGVNLNAWLLANGYLALRDGADPARPWLQSVDWSRTRAYAVGLVGIFLNLKGREAEGIVEPGDEAAALKSELAARLGGLVDDETGTIAINEAFDTDTLYRGPYKGNAPDLLIGYNHGYRISWGCASGVVAGRVFEDNVKAWSGDHIVDPRLVPGVLFCDRAVSSDDPHITDLAPTVLTLFGIRPPGHMDGRPLIEKERP
ncbi:MAG: alkaline phosphatase family protein [Thermoanaerobaculales bacterium]|jgi:predicted AlkP superfamily phosphohydrolase/phosphomutase|nr:alkaline phosphatase family protein [Thermoanaerobaculales bacterium]